MIIVTVMVILVVGAGVALYAGFLIGRMRDKASFEEHLRVEKEASEQRLLEVQAQQREALHEARDETARFRTTIEHENSERRDELQRKAPRFQLTAKALQPKLTHFNHRTRNTTH